MKYGEAIRACLSKYGTFSGRARVEEWGWWFLTVTLLNTALYGLKPLGDFQIGGLSLLLTLGGLVSMLTIIPTLAVTVRRFHDQGKSGWNILWSLLPGIGWVVFIILALRPGQANTNTHGPNPRIQK